MVAEANRHSSSSASFYALLIACAILAISVIVNFLLAEKLRTVNHKLSKVENEIKLSVGTSVPDIEAKDLSGADMAFSYSLQKRPTVLYVFSPSCNWCERNRDNLQTLYDNVSRDYSFVALSISNKNVSEYALRQNWKFPVFTDPSPDTLLTYKFSGTPQTFVISEEGIVLQNWTGAYMTNVQRDVEGFFGIKLPGVR